MISYKEIIRGAVTCANQEKCIQVNRMEYVFDPEKAFFKLIFPKSKFDKESKKFKDFLNTISILEELEYIKVVDGEYLQDCFFVTKCGLTYLQEKNKAVKEKMWNFAFTALGAICGAFLTWLFKA